MFEREYHTLVQLAHPRIVRVFDYGRHGSSPYYTMELLDGRDAREAAKRRQLGVRRVCSLLRDAASALALIHSRRMVHRDVSPRNLWCIARRARQADRLRHAGGDGPADADRRHAAVRAARGAFTCSRSMRAAISTRSAALAYFLLTGRNAYPAREVAELRDCWQRRPKRPDALRPDVPRALSDLVMALLSLDARGPAGLGGRGVRAAERDRRAARTRTNAATRRRS